MKIRYPSILDMNDELDKFNDLIEKIEGVSVVEITHSLIVISDGNEEYEYDSVLEAMEEWKDVLSRRLRDGV